MCGITGILDARGPVERETLARMANALRHRGPDDEGYHLSEPQAGGVHAGLGFRRLAIIDLNGGRQPMSNEDGSLWMVCNGEVYNHLELRRELEGKGHRFRTGSDSETFLHLYEEHGEECVNRVNGMFAVAIWNAREQTLFLARDRLGEKPLYYREAGGLFLFASEVKALLQHPACPRELDFAVLGKYLAYEYVPSPHCIFKGIHKLPAGHSLAWKNGKSSVKRYWDLRFSEGPERRSEAAIGEELRARLKEAVRLRLISDVPLGVFLSGGIDSSAVLAMMAELQPASQINTFSIGFHERSFDESAHARRVAAFFGAKHHEEMLHPRVLLEMLPEVAALLDEPLADASIIPTYLLSRFTRRHVTVALGGDGGDELFAGYPTFQAHRLAQFYRLPRVLHERFVRPLAGLLPVSDENFSFDFKVRRFLRGVDCPLEIRDQVWLGAFRPEEQLEILNGRIAQADRYEDILECNRHCASADPVERMVYFYAKFYLQDGVLVKLDRATMACALEARAPFLDHSFVEFANSIPSGLKLKGCRIKYILKRALEGRLPSDILARPKKGFGIPVAKWFRDGLRDLALDALSEERIKRQGLFNGSAVTRLLDEHLKGKRNHGKQLWTLLMFQLWAENYLDRGAEPANASESPVFASSTR